MTIPLNEPLVKIPNDQWLCWEKHLNRDFHTTWVWFVYNLVGVVSNVFLLSVWWSDTHKALYTWTPSSWITGLRNKPPSLYLFLRVNVIQLSHSNLGQYYVISLHPFSWHDQTILDTSNCYVFTWSWALKNDWIII